MVNRSKIRRRALRIEHLETRRLMAGDTWLVNFQNDEATLPTRYSRHRRSVRHAWRRAELRLVVRSHGSSPRTKRRSRSTARYADPRRGGSEMGICAGERPVRSHRRRRRSGEQRRRPHDQRGRRQFLERRRGHGRRLVKTMQVTVADGRLTHERGAAANMATRINYIHIVGLTAGGTPAPSVRRSPSPPTGRRPIRPTCTWRPLAFPIRRQYP